ncbi:hypothetical protein [Nocardia sp. NBC_01329]|uniref:hypothetical protein n=1 Tax=Nocardia sp. NBC_01329 TaxID=2903594 RepID=UPI002E125467
MNLGSSCPTKGLRGTYNDLDAEKTTALSVIGQLDATDAHRPGTADIGLLDALTYLAINLADAPEALQRKLFKIIQPAVRLPDDDARATAIDDIRGCGQLAIMQVKAIFPVLFQNYEFESCSPCKGAATTTPRWSCSCSSRACMGMYAG